MTNDQKPTLMVCGFGYLNRNEYGFHREGNGFAYGYGNTYGYVFGFSSRYGNCSGFGYDYSGGYGKVYGSVSGNRLVKELDDD